MPPQTIPKPSEQGGQSSFPVNGLIKNSGQIASLALKYKLGTGAGEAPMGSAKEELQTRVESGLAALYQRNKDFYLHLDWKGVKGAVETLVSRLSSSPNRMDALEACMGNMDKWLEEKSFMKFTANAGYFDNNSGGFGADLSAFLGTHAPAKFVSEPPKFHLTPDLSKAKFGSLTRDLSRSELGLLQRDFLELQGQCKAVYEVMRMHDEKEAKAFFEQGLSAKAISFNMKIVEGMFDLLSQGAFRLDEEAKLPEMINEHLWAVKDILSAIFDSALPHFTLKKEGLVDLQLNRTNPEVAAFLQIAMRKMDEGQAKDFYYFLRDYFVWKADAVHGGAKYVAEKRMAELGIGKESMHDELEALDDAKKGFSKYPMLNPFKSDQRRYDGAIESFLGDISKIEQASAYLMYRIEGEKKHDIFLWFDVTRNLKDDLMGWVDVGLTVGAVMVGGWPELTYFTYSGLKQAEESPWSSTVLLTAIWGGRFSKVLGKVAEGSAFLEGAQILSANAGRAAGYYLMGSMGVGIVKNSWDIGKYGLSNARLQGLVNDVAMLYLGEKKAQSIPAIQARYRVRAADQNFLQALYKKNVGQQDKFALVEKGVLEVEKQAAKFRKEGKFAAEADLYTTAAYRIKNNPDRLPDNPALAKNLFAKTLSGHAADLLDKASVAEEKHADQLAARGSYADARNAYDYAAEHTSSRERKSELAEKSSKMLEKEGQSLEADGDVEGAITKYGHAREKSQLGERKAELDEKCSQVSQTQAEKCLRRGNFEEAKTWYNQAINYTKDGERKSELSKHATQAFEGRAVELEAEGRFGEASELYSSSWNFSALAGTGLREGPKQKSLSAIQKQAEAHMAAGEFEKAGDWYHKAYQDCFNLEANAANTEAMKTENRNKASLAYEKQAEKLEAEGKLSDAADFYKKAFDYNVSSADTFFPRERGDLLGEKMKSVCEKYARQLEAEGNANGAAEWYRKAQGTASEEAFRLEMHEAEKAERAGNDAEACGWYLAASKHYEPKYGYGANPETATKQAEICNKASLAAEREAIKMEQQGQNGDAYSWYEKAGDNSSDVMKRFDLLDKAASSAEKVAEYYSKDNPGKAREWHLKAKKQATTAERKYALSEKASLSAEKEAENYEQKGELKNAASSYITAKEDSPSEGRKSLLSEKASLACQKLAEELEKAGKQTDSYEWYLKAIKNSVSEERIDLLSGKASVAAENAADELIRKNSMVAAADYYSKAGFSAISKERAASLYEKSGDTYISCGKIEPALLEYEKSKKQESKKLPSVEGKISQLDQAKSEIKKYAEEKGLKKEAADKILPCLEKLQIGKIEDVGPLGKQMADYLAKSGEEHIHFINNVLPKIAVYIVDAKMSGTCQEFFNSRIILNQDILRYANSQGVDLSVPAQAGQFLSKLRKSKAEFLKKCDDTGYLNGLPKEDLRIALDSYWFEVMPISRESYLNFIDAAMEKLSKPPKRLGERLSGDAEISVTKLNVTGTAKIDAKIDGFRSKLAEFFSKYQSMSLDGITRTYVDLFEKGGIDKLTSGMAEKEAELFRQYTAAGLYLNYAEKSGNLGIEPSLRSSISAHNFSTLENIVGDYIENHGKNILKNPLRLEALKAKITAMDGLREDTRAGLLAAFNLPPEAQFDRLKEIADSAPKKQQKALVPLLLGPSIYTLVRESSTIRSDIGKATSSTGEQVAFTLVAQKSMRDMFSGFMSGDCTRGRTEFFNYFMEEGWNVKIYKGDDWKGNLYLFKVKDALVVDALQVPFADGYDQVQLWSQVIGYGRTVAKQHGLKFMVSDFRSNYPELKNAFGKCIDEMKPARVEGKALDPYKKELQKKFYGTESSGNNVLYLFE